MMIMFQAHYRGEAAIIANECKTDVISNFRVMDMAGRWGRTPLVPYSETLLYKLKIIEAVALQEYQVLEMTVLPKGDEKKVVLSIRVQNDD